MSLDGCYNGTKIKVNPNDIIDRKNAIKALEEVFGWDLESNPEEYKIDLKFKNRKGGVDVEKKPGKGYYRDQNPHNFNKFTLPVPTGNLSWRKEHFFNRYYTWISSKGQRLYGEEPDFEFNSVIRFTNNDYDEFFFVDYETYKKIYDTGLKNELTGGLSKGRGYWATDTIWSTDKYGNKVPEYWMCWELNVVPFYRKTNGIWLNDTSFDDPKVYGDFLEKYRKAQIDYQLKNKK